MVENNGGRGNEIRRGEEKEAQPPHLKQRSLQRGGAENTTIVSCKFHCTLPVTLRRTKEMERAILEGSFAPNFHEKNVH